MGIVMTEHDTITQHARAFTSDNFRWPSDYSLFPKLRGHLSGTKFSSDSDVKTAAEKCGREFYPAGVNELVLRSDKCLNIFDDDMEK
ncbi:hypothetical protein AVEN_102248-1 [Araneus ventricosus]|uniref:Uncharacterized protein n=1 Tax=Araneus ventricosus TaxID=182803 RepID=A0A4Y2RIH6_ARAVE|nr:hypothetical protein AVEN_102248-1 [Araneus ventricosus]